jgi:hypothetical protein
MVLVHWEKSTGGEDVALETIHLGQSEGTLPPS